MSQSYWSQYYRAEDFLCQMRMRWHSHGYVSKPTSNSTHDEHELSCDNGKVIRLKHQGTTGQDATTAVGICGPKATIVGKRGDIKGSTVGGNGGNTATGGYGGPKATAAGGKGEFKSTTAVGEPKMSAQLLTAFKLQKDSLSNFWVRPYGTCGRKKVSNKATTAGGNGGPEATLAGRSGDLKATTAGGIGVPKATADVGKGDPKANTTGGYYGPKATVGCGEPKTTEQLLTAFKRQKDSLSNFWVRPYDTYGRKKGNEGGKGLMFVPGKGVFLTATERKKRKRENKRRKKALVKIARLEQKIVRLQQQQQQEKQQSQLQQQQHQEELWPNLQQKEQEFQKQEQVEQASQKRQQEQVEQQVPLINASSKCNISSPDNFDHVNSMSERKKRKWDDVENGSGDIETAKENGNLETSSLNASQALTDVQDSIHIQNVTKIDENVFFQDEYEEMDISDDDDNEGNDSVHIVDESTESDQSHDGKRASAPFLSAVTKMNSFSISHAREEESDKQISCHQLKLPEGSKSECQNNVISKSSNEGFILQKIEHVASSTIVQQKEESIAQKRLRLAKALKKVAIEKAKAKLRMAQIKKQEALDSKLLQEKNLRKSKSSIGKMESARNTSSSPMPVEVVAVLSEKLPDITAFRMKELIISGINKSGPASMVRFKRTFSGVSSKVNPESPADGEAQTGTTRTIPQINLELQRKKLKLEALKAQALKRAKSRQNTSETTNNNEGIIPEKGAGLDNVFDVPLNVEGEEEVEDKLGGGQYTRSENILENEETIDNLRKRQMQLKESIVSSRETYQELRHDSEVADLRVMIEKQQKILKEHGETLRIGRITMKVYTEQIHEEKKEVIQSENRVADLLKKKEMMQNMVRSVSKQVMDARRKRNILRQDTKEVL